MAAPVFQHQRFECQYLQQNTAHLVLAMQKREKEKENKDYTGHRANGVKVKRLVI